MLFIDAAHAEYTKLLPKNLGKKRFEVSDDGAADILAIYRAYQPCTREIVYEKTGEVETLEIAKLLDYDDFRYTTVTTRRPLRLFYKDVNNKIMRMKEDGRIAKGDRELFDTILAGYDASVQRTDEEFMAIVAKLIGKKKVNATQAKKLRVLGETDETAPIVYTNPGDASSDPIADTALNDTEKIPMKQNINEYFEREVLPYAPDAWMDRSKDKLGVEFPFTRLFYVYRPLRSSEAILAELNKLDEQMDKEISALSID